MAIGDATELVNAQNLKLGLTDASLANRYVMLQELDFHLEENNNHYFHRESMGLTIFFREAKKIQIELDELFDG